mmetsp:Transcript_30712/g.53406  ORF Transcript_30712/g.53406 Transcript_30712/m.53406 type:complete len:278 (-) Transcript_30712:118-951(-)
MLLSTSSSQPEDGPKEESQRCGGKRDHIERHAEVRHRDQNNKPRCEAESPMCIARLAVPKLGRAKRLDEIINGTRIPLLGKLNLQPRSGTDVEAFFTGIRELPQLDEFLQDVKENADSPSGRHIQGEEDFCGRTLPGNRRHELQAEALHSLETSELLSWFSRPLQRSPECVPHGTEKERQLFHEADTPAWAVVGEAQQVAAMRPLALPLLTNNVSRHRQTSITSWKSLAPMNNSPRLWCVAVIYSSSQLMRRLEFGKLACGESKCGDVTLCVHRLRP